MSGVRPVTAPVLGVLGSGQLGRMLALAAAPLGVRVHVFAPEPGPATQVTDRATIAPYADTAALRAFARACDAVTFEFENVPAEVAEQLAAHTVVRPGPRALAICQDRIAEKTFLGDDAGVPTAPWREVGAVAEAADFLRACGTPIVLKTARFGYDGKGQAIVRDPAELPQAWARLTARPDVAILAEGFVSFEYEASVVLARGTDGSIAAYELARNVHRDHVLHTTTVPAGAPDAVVTRAAAVATRIAEALDYVGVLGVELFVSADGTVRVNELAPRVHNSGHWTQDGAVTCQFEQHVRAVLGWPLGDPSRRGGAWRMTNLLGDDVFDVPRWTVTPGAHLHLYGKTEARPGRKMGHVNVAIDPA